METINIISFIIGVLGVGLSIYFGIEARQLAEKVRKISWADIELGMKYLSTRIIKEFGPEVILCSSGGSVGIVANLFLTYTDKFIPLYIGISRKVSEEFTSEPIYKTHYKTSRWITYIPEDVFKYKDKKILILEDVALSGETLGRIVDLLVSKGVDRKNILTATLYVTELAITSNRTPDIYWHRLSDTHFYFPWGRSTGKGY